MNLDIKVENLLVLSFILIWSSMNERDRSKMAIKHFSGSYYLRCSILGPSDRDLVPDHLLFWLPWLIYLSSLQQEIDAVLILCQHQLQDPILVRRCTESWQWLYRLVSHYTDWIPSLSHQVNFSITFLAGSELSLPISIFLSFYPQYKMGIESGCRSFFVPPSLLTSLSFFLQP
jgi:hypothetical protein